RHVDGVEFVERAQLAEVVKRTTRLIRISLVRLRDGLVEMRLVDVADGGDTEPRIGQQPGEMVSPHPADADDPDDQPLARRWGGVRSTAATREARNAADRGRTEKRSTRGLPRSSHEKTPCNCGEKKSRWSTRQSASHLRPNVRG